MGLRVNNSKIFYWLVNNEHEAQIIRSLYHNFTFNYLSILTCSSNAGRQAPCILTSSWTIEILGNSKKERSNKGPDFVTSTHHHDKFEVGPASKRSFFRLHRRNIFSIISNFFFFMRAWGRCPHKEGNSSYSIVTEENCGWRRVSNLIR